MKQKNLDIDTEKLHQVLSYDKKSGLIRYKKRYSRMNAGDIAGSYHSDGYIKICFMGKMYQAHRLAWFMVCGEWPDEIDHINHIKDDNRWRNLRNVTRSENNRNRSLQSNNTSGHHGITYVEKNNHWQVYCCKKYIGSRKTKKEAVKLRKKAEKEHGYHENHGT